ncbi:MAG TPA: cob(I)yrinic acid a,c-diamide adenosyltransferase [Planctomycetaceae bacterium]|nr:cob(I)yrinic acid a,c-diamide adenosyltransferase [Planctomycetaceae bacterium]
MVYLNRIYTRTGDDGTTSLGDGSRVPKTHPRIAAYGGVDELNSVLGLALAAGLPGEIGERLRDVQNDLFDLGADLCVPERDERAAPAPLRVTAGHVDRLEGWIDAANERLEPLRSFVLPGGTSAAAHLHHARTVCRRAEISVLRLAAAEPVNPQVAVYLNRLSDLLFVLARVCNDDGQADILWQPGRGGRTATSGPRPDDD